MANALRLHCHITVDETRVASRRSFRRTLLIGFRPERSRGEVLYFEGTLLRVPDGFAVASIDCNHLNIPADQQAEMLFAIHAASGLDLEFGPVGDCTVDFSIDTGDGSVLASAFRHLPTAAWHPKS